MLIGYQAVYDESYLDALGFAEANGFDYVQFDLNVPHLSLHRLSAGDRRQIRDAARDRGVGLSFHAPGDDVSLFTCYPGMGDAIVRHFAEIIAMAGEMGARHLTVHPGARPSFRPADGYTDAFAERYDEHYARMLEDNLAELARGDSRVLICVENVGMDSVTRGALDRVLRGSSRVFLTWDVAKSHGHGDVESFYREHQATIREVHFHDMRPGSRSHLSLGQGVLDLTPFLPLVRSPEVATTIEVRPREAAAESRMKLMDLLRIP